MMNRRLRARPVSTPKRTGMRWRIATSTETGCAITCGGGAMDADPSSACSEVILEDSLMRTHYWADGHLAGAHFWCYMDYSSGRNSVGHQGTIDRIWPPQGVYFKMRNTLAGKATGYWTNGTPARRRLMEEYQIKNNTIVYLKERRNAYR